MHNQWCNPVVEVSQHEFTVTSVLRTNDYTFCCFTCLYVDFSQYLALLNGFYLPPARAWAPIVPFLADLFLELIDSIQRSSALESKSLCVDGVGRSVTVNNQKMLQLIPSMTDSSPVPYVNDAPETWANQWAPFSCSLVDQRFWVTWVSKDVICRLVIYLLSWTGFKHDSMTLMSSWTHNWNGLLALKQIKTVLSTKSINPIWLERFPHNYYALGQ